MNHRTVYRNLGLLALMLFTMSNAATAAGDPYRQAPGISAGSANCPHVRILTKEDAALVEEQFRGAIKGDVGVNQREALQIALDALPPLVCRSVQKVVFLNAVLPSSGEALAWVGKSRPDLINISAVSGNASETRLEVRDLANNEAGDVRASLVKVWPEVIHSIIHEAYHCAAHLMESFGPDYEGPPNVWPADTRQTAEKFVDDARLRDGFRSEWERLNSEFADIGYGTGYDRGRKGRLQAPPLGFMTVYGGATVGEDIAEAASWVIAKPLMSRQYKGVTPNVAEWQYACSKLEAYKGIGVPTELAALYTKLSFLRDIGFISDDDILGCMGSGSVGLIGNGEIDGIRFFEYKTWRHLSSYDTDLKATRTGDMFGVSAWSQITVAGKSYRALVEIDFRVGETKLPRGIYKISLCNVLLPVGQVPFTSRVLFRRRVEGNNSQSICASQAQVLVTRATESHIEGSVFLEKAWKFSTPPVPEVSGFPVHVIFSIKR